MTNLSMDHKGELYSLIVPATRSYLLLYTAEDTRTLEIGCGPGQYRLAVRGYYVGVDITSQPYREGLPRLIDAVADANSLPFRPAMFDLVFFSNIFHYFPNGVDVLKRTLQVLKPGGILLVFDYAKPTLRRLGESYSINSPGWEAQIRDCSDWLLLMNQAGLENVEVAKGSNSIINKLMRSILPSASYYSFIDHREGSVVVKGEKTDD